MRLLGTASICLVVFVSLITMVIQRNHLLIILLALEIIVLRIIFILLLQLRGAEFYLCFVMLTFAACEASLGLSCLVYITRSYGNDKVRVLARNKC